VAAASVETMQSWLAAAEICNGPVFREVKKGGRVQAAPLTPHRSCINKLPALVRSAQTDWAGEGSRRQPVLSGRSPTRRSRLGSGRHPVIVRTQSRACAAGSAAINLRRQPSNDSLPTIPSG
jgi:hypothetical protein